MVLYKKNMFAEMVARELRDVIEGAFSIQKIKHLYDSTVLVDYILLKEVNRDEGTPVYSVQLHISSNLLLSEYKEICESLEKKIKSLEDENLNLKEENDRLFRDLQGEINPCSEEYDDPLLEGTI